MLRDLYRLAKGLAESMLVSLRCLYHRIRYEIRLLKSEIQKDRESNSWAVTF